MTATVRRTIHADNHGGRAADTVLASLAALRTHLHEATDEQALEVLIQDALQECNRAVFAACHEEMLAASVVVLAFSGAAWCVGHVGDARAYSADNTGARLLTEDHSLFAEQLRSGALTESDFGSFVHGTVVTQVVGLRSHISPRTITGALRSGTSFVLCSRRLWQALGPRQIAEVLQRNYCERILSAERVLSELPHNHEMHHA